MKNKFGSIDDALEIEATSVETEVVKRKSAEILKSLPLGDCDKDFEYSRGQLYNLIEKGQEAVSDIIELAQQSESPRAYEVAFQGIKNVADITDKLIDLQQKMKKLKEDDIKAPSTINNTMFVGSTAELQKLLKQNSFKSK